MSAVLSKSVPVLSSRYVYGQSTHWHSLAYGVLLSLNPPSQRAQTSVARDHSPTQTGYLMFLAFLTVLPYPSQ